MNLRRVSFLTTITLCALALLFSGPSASAAARVIGRLQISPPALNVKINGKPAAPGAVVHDGDLVETGGNSAVICLNDGQCVLVNANSAGRIYEPTGQAVTFVASKGGFRLLHEPGTGSIPPYVPGGGSLPGGTLPGGGLPGGPGSEPGEGSGLDGLPPLGSFSFGNFSGTSVGGGGSGSAGPTTTRVIPGLGVGLFDSFGTFIRFL